VNSRRAIRATRLSHGGHSRAIRLLPFAAAADSAPLMVEFGLEPVAAGSNACWIFLRPDHCYRIYVHVNLC
jgi:hypothetical protein